MPKKKKNMFLSLFGAFGGDMRGGPYEFSFGASVPAMNADMKIYKKQKKDYDHIFTDDSVLTAAIAQAIMEARGKSDEEFKLAVTVKLKEFVRKYPNGTFPGGYGEDFIKWAETEGTEPMKGKLVVNEDGSTYYRKSCGDGSAMRVSAVGWAYNSLEQTLHYAGLTAEPSHGDPEGIKGAQAIAAAIYLSRAGIGKENIKLYLETKFGYNLDTTVEQYRNYNKDELTWQGETCPTAVPMAIRAFLESNSYDECIQNTINMGGDVDTIGAIAGSIAGAYFGLSKETEKEIEESLDETLLNTAKGFQEYIDSIDTEPRMDEIEIALARARLEKYALEQYKADNNYVPNKDPQYLEKLAEMEATRLFYEEVNKSDDKSRKQELTDNKASFMALIKDDLKQSPQFLYAYNNMTKCPVKIVDVPDYDLSIRRNRDDRSIFPAQRLEADHAMIPEKVAGYGNTIHNLIDNARVINATAREAIKLLCNDVRRTDSIFSSDSQEFKDFRASLNSLSERLNNGNIKSINDLLSVFKETDSKNNSVFSYASEYADKKLIQEKELSDRQMDRISICARLISIQNSLMDAQEAANAGKTVTCKREILEDTVAQKALVGAMKSLGNAEARKTFKSQALYQERLAKMKAAFKSKPEKTLSELAKKQSAAVAETIAPGALKKAEKHTASELQQAIGNMSQSQAKMAAVAQYLLERSGNMLNELEAIDSFTHSDAYRNFKHGVENLHESIVGIAIKNDFGQKSLADALEQVSGAADIYRIQHADDDPEYADMKVVNRLGLAAEINICQEFLNDPANTEPEDLFMKLNFHQDMMRDLTRRGTVYQSEKTLEDLDNFLFDKQKSPKSEDKQKAFPDSFKKLLDPKAYREAVDKEFNERRAALSEADKKLVTKAAAQNKPLDALKKAEEKKIQGNAQAKGLDKQVNEADSNVQAQNSETIQNPMK